MSSMILMLQHGLTRLVMPCGLIWIGIGLCAAVAWRAKQRWLARSLMLLLVVYTLAGNLWVSTAINYYLERPYRDRTIDPAARYDAVIVLGGSTDDAPNGRPYLNSSGDRVMLAARLYHRGQTEYVVCTGARANKKPDGRRDPAESAALILVDVGVDGDRIVRMGGRFTKEEMTEIKRLVNTRGWKRVGLITSAWHMRRAMRLAKRVGLEVTPLAADFHSRFPPWDPFDVIPRSDALRATDLACRELLAGLVGR